MNKIKRIKMWLMYRRYLKQWNSILNQVASSRLEARTGIQRIKCNRLVDDAFERIESIERKMDSVRFWWMPKANKGVKNDS